LNSSVEISKSLDGDDAYVTDIMLMFLITTQKISYRMKKKPREGALFIYKTKR
jgi:hypothetical protein